MQNSLGLKILFGLCLVAAVGARAQSAITILVEGKSKNLSLAELKSKLKTQTVTLADPVYKAQKSYDAFALSEVLALGGFTATSPGDEIVFTALDGYAPNTSLKMLRSHPAFLAYQEHGKAETFEKLAQGKTMLSPAPFYVVWSEGAVLADAVPWPYQLASIEIVDFKNKFPKSFPAGISENSAAYRGFQVFKEKCLRCHSINLEGGDVGPELNAPKNVTEYWGRENLKKFIRESTSFRYKSKMPNFPELKNDEIENILKYWELMKGRKIIAG